MTPIDGSRRSLFTAYLAAGCHRALWLINRVQSAVLSFFSFAGWSYYSHSGVVDQKSRWQYSLGGDFTIDKKIRDFAKNHFNFTLPKQGKFSQNIAGHCRAGSLKFLATNASNLDEKTTQLTEIYHTLVGSLPKFKDEDECIKADQNVMRFTANLMGLEITEVMEYEVPRETLFSKIDTLEEGKYTCTFGIHDIGLKIENEQATLCEMNQGVVSLPKAKLRNVLKPLALIYGSKRCTLSKLEIKADLPQLLRDTIS